MSADDPAAKPARKSLLRGAVVMLMGVLALTTPLYAGAMTFLLLGTCAVVAGLLELLETYRTSDEGEVQSAFIGGEMSIVIGLLLLSVPTMVVRGVALLLGVTFALDAAGKLFAAYRARREGRPFLWPLTLAGVTALLAAALISRWPVKEWYVVSLVVGVRMIAAGWSIARGRHTGYAVAPPAPDAHPDARLGLDPNPAFVGFNDDASEREKSLAPIERWYAGVFIFLFLIIHIGRMRVYWNAVGLVAPIAAVIGDLMVALIFAFAVVLPLRVVWRSLTRPLERRAWNAVLSTPDPRPTLLGRLRLWWLSGRLGFARSFARMRTSPTSAVAWGLKVGLPFAVVWVAIQPLFGNLNYFFNSENWSSLVWHRWAETRTDRWRESMIIDLEAAYPDVPPEKLFRVDPPGLAGDFSFLVIGDQGDGSGAQHSLRDRLIERGKRDDVKFLVCSSDVIYPDGAMRDYEHHFHLPFKGFTKPIYGIPGNHDWYDALEGFSANFLSPDAARTVMRSRVKTDARLTTTTEDRIDGYIRGAERLKVEYGIDVGTQRGPMFEVQADRFALIAVDTGVQKTTDSAQLKWLRSALERSRGKFTMVLLGHPLYTAGHYQGDADAPTGEESPKSPVAGADGVSSLTDIHRLLKTYDVPLVMAGDMHLFEHYREKYESNGRSRTMHHFVNGGGGAYICVGVPFDFPRVPATEDWAYYPRKDVVTKKLDEQTPLLKYPLWLWVKHLSAWPFNGYIMSAAFDHSRAPFLQSFVEVRVSNSRGEVVICPVTANGPMRWRELQNGEAIRPAGKSADDAVEFVIPMSPR